MYWWYVVMVVVVVVVVVAVVVHILITTSTLQPSYNVEIVQFQKSKADVLTIQTRVQYIIFCCNRETFYLQMTGTVLNKRHISVTSIYYI